MARGKINDAAIQAVRDAADIVTVAREYTQLERAGNGYKGLSPFRKEKTPSFTIDPDKGLYYCFSSGIGGDAIHLHMQMTGDTFLDAIESLAERFGVPLPERAAGTGAPQRDTRAALEAGQAFFRAQLAKSALASAYLDRRDIAPELIERFGLGYAPDAWDHLLGSLRGRVPAADLEAVGLVGASKKSGELYDRFRHRLTFPIHAGSGRLVGFGGRALGDDPAKYVNTSETDFFHKGRLLYGLHQAKRAMREQRQAILVEGYFDVIGAVAAGIEGAVAGMGTALTTEQAKLLAQQVDEVVVAYDGDEAGERAFARSLPVLLGVGLAVRRARLPAGSDPDSFRVEHGPAALVRAIEEAEDAVWLLITRALPAEREPSPVVLDRAAARVLEVVRLVGDPLVRGAYVRRAAERLGVREVELLGRLDGPVARLGVPAVVSSTEEKRDAPVVLGMEARALILFFDQSLDPLPIEHLPAPDVFFDPSCRNIFQAFCDCYRSAGGVAPSSSEVMDRLRELGADLDSAARILLTSSVLDDEGSSETSEPADNELPEILDNLQRRWSKTRLVALHQQIRQALAQGDEARASLLRDEKNTLTRSLHPDATGTL